MISLQFLLVLFSYLKSISSEESRNGNGFITDRLCVPRMPRSSVEFRAMAETWMRAEATQKKDSKETW